MPTYLITSPEGRKYQVTGSGTKEEALAHLQGQLTGQVSNEPAKADRILSGGETAMDVAKSAGIGLANTGVGLAGLPGDMQRLAVGGLDWLGKKVGLPEPTPEQMAQFGGFDREKAMLPGSQQIREKIEGVTGKFYEPQTVPGEYARTGGEFAVGALAPGGLVRKAAMIAAPALASETAGQLTKGTEAEPYARFAGAMAGGLGAARRGGDAMSKASRQAPSADAIKAETNRLYDTLRNAGIKYDANAYGSFTARLAQVMKDKGLDPVMHPKASRAMERIIAEVGTSPDFTTLDTLRKVAREGTKSIEAADKFMAGKIVEYLDRFSTGATFIGPPNTIALQKQARDLASRNIKGRILDDAVEAAQTYQSGFESGLRNQFSNLLRNKRKLRGFTESERQAIQQVAKGNFTSNTLGILGKFGFDLGNLGHRSVLLPSALFGGGALADQAVTGGAGVVAATGAKYAARKMTEKAAARAQGVVRAGRGEQAKALAATRAEKLKERLRRLLALTGSTVDAVGSATSQSRAPVSQ